MKNSFTISDSFDVKPEILNNAWLSSKEHSRFTGSKAAIDPVVGGKFTAWDEYIGGKTIELKKNKRISQAWRTTNFPKESPDSKLEIVFEETKKGTKLILNHSDIPDGQAEEYKNGWKDYYFQPMKEYFDKSKEKNRKESVG